MIQMKPVGNIIKDNLSVMSNKELKEKYLYSEYINYGRHCVFILYRFVLKIIKSVFLKTKIMNTK